MKNQSRKRIGNGEPAKLTTNYPSKVSQLKRSQNDIYENQDRLRVGIVGCGYQGGILARTIAESDTFQVTACADPDQDAAGRVAALTGNAAMFASVDEMLQHAEVDTVIVATSHDALYECSLAAIRVGKHVLTEKPVGMDEKEAAQLEDAVTRADICFMAGYSFRYFAAWQKVYELLQAGAVGEIQTIVGSMTHRAHVRGLESQPGYGRRADALCRIPYDRSEFSGIWVMIRSRLMPTSAIARIRRQMSSRHSRFDLHGVQ